MDNVGYFYLTNNLNMEDNIIPQEEDDSSLVEIEVAEDEEIEVEESETQKDNTFSNEIQKKSEKELLNDNILDSKNNINYKFSGKKEEEEIQKQNQNLEQVYSETELKIIDIFNGDKTIINLLNNKKWEEKKNGFILLKEYIKNILNKEKITTNFEILFNYIQKILKNFKESNLIILKEGLECIYYLLNLDNILMNNKTYMNILITELYEKIIENKIKYIYIKLIDTLMNIYNPNDVVNYLVQIIKKSNKTLLLKEYSFLLKNYLNSHTNNIKLLNMKEIIDFSIKIGNNSNIELRILSCDIICLLYNYLSHENIIYIKNKLKKSFFNNIEMKIKEINKEEIMNKDYNSINNNLLEKFINEVYEKNTLKKKEIKNKNRLDISKYITPILLKY